MDYRHTDAAMSDPSFFVDHDPHPLWKELRENDPIHWTDDSRKGFWSITRYEDIVAVVGEPALFSSAYLVSIPSSPEMEQVTPAMLGSGEMMLMTDPAIARGDAAGVQSIDAASRGGPLRGSRSAIGPGNS